jgi:hypothetical protein
VCVIILTVDDNNREEVAIMTWRRKGTRDTWHFCKNCSNWPTEDYEEKTTKPTSGELCDQCLAKQKADNCK